MIDGKFFFHQSEKKNTRTFEPIRKVATGQGDNYTTGCLPDYIYFKNYYKIIALDLSKQQALDTDPNQYRKLYWKSRKQFVNIFHY